MLITTTQFTLKSWRSYPKFFVDTYAVVRQARRSGGLVKMQIRPIQLRTITAWKSREDMLRFRNSGAHLEAMKKSASYGAIASVSWQADKLPSWKEAVWRLNAAKGSP